MHKAAHLAAYAISHILAGRLDESVVQQSALEHEPKPRLSPRQSRKARKAEQRAQAQKDTK